MRSGAGKTTAMRVILGLDAPDAGQALVGGRPYGSLRRPLTLIGPLIPGTIMTRPGHNAGHPAEVGGHP